MKNTKRRVWVALRIAMHRREQDLPRPTSTKSSPLAVVAPKSVRVRNPGAAAAAAGWFARKRNRTASDAARPSSVPYLCAASCVCCVRVCCACVVRAGASSAASRVSRLSFVLSFVVVVMVVVRACRLRA